MAIYIYFNRCYSFECYKVYFYHLLMTFFLDYFLLLIVEANPCFYINFNVEERIFYLDYSEMIHFVE